MMMLNGWEDGSLGALIMALVWAFFNWHGKRNATPGQTAPVNSPAKKP